MDPVVSAPAPAPAESPGQAEASSPLKTPTIKLKLSAAPPTPEGDEASRQSDDTAAVQESRPKAPKRVRKPSQRSETVSKNAKAPGTSPRTRASSARKPKRKQKKMITLRYVATEPLPEFQKIDLLGAKSSVSLFWLRLNIREFFLRFDKLVRLPTKHLATVNDPLQPWSDQFYKASVVALFKVLQNDTVPLFPQSRTYLADIEHCSADSVQLWVLVQDFLGEVDPYVDGAVEKLSGEEHRLELLRRLMVLCTGTDTIRVTVMDDNEQLRHVQQDTAAEIKRLNQQWKATEKKLAHLRTVDMDAWRTKVDNARGVADQRVFKVRQTVFQQIHKYNLRTAPLGSDSWGNVYWSLQYKGKENPDWGTWIICELSRSPQVMTKWQQQFPHDVGVVLDTRSAPRGEQSKGKRYPKVKIHPPEPLPVGSEDRLYFVEGSEAIAQLSRWIEAQIPTGRYASLSKEIREIAEYMAV